jgi:hypothetical protein
METCIVRIPGEDVGLPGLLLGIDLDSSLDINRQVLVCDGTDSGDLVDIGDLVDTDSGDQRDFEQDSCICNC